MPNLMALSTRQTLVALLAFAAMLSATGLVLEFVFHVLPCQMCWWQRYAHYAVLAFASAGLVGRLPKTALVAILIASLAGLGIACWQFAAQHGWLPFPASCSGGEGQTFATAENLLEAMNQTKIVPCDKETFTLLGLSLAGYNIPAMLLTTALSGATLLRKSIK